MTAVPRPFAMRSVPSRIAGPLRRVARRRWRLLAVRGIVQTLLAGLTLLLAAALLVGLFNYAAAPVAVRVAVSAIVWGAVVAAGGYFLRPVVRRRSLAQTA